MNSPGCVPAVQIKRTNIPWNGGHNTDFTIHISNYKFREACRAQRGGGFGGEELVSLVMKNARKLKKIKFRATMNKSWC